MPAEMAATVSFSGSVISTPFSNSFCTAMLKATNAPLMLAVRVPPSAWITSQSIRIWRSPNKVMSTTARSERPIRRWISWVRPDCLPAAASRRMRLAVEAGSIPYSAVTQPWPLPRKKGGTLSSMVAVQMTLVLPHSIKTEPSACGRKLGVKVRGRSSSAARSVRT